MYDLITFGETMLRLSPPGVERLEDTPTLDVSVGGAESNVAVNLARLGRKAAWFSKLPDNPLGHTVRNALRHHGVNTEHIIWTDDERLGLYFVEYGHTPRGIRVWYDRKQSAASSLTTAELPLPAIADAKWLHVTGITPALGKTCADAVAVAVQHAQTNGVRVSLDINYRALLWEPQQAVNALEPLCQAADVVFVAQRDAVSLWGSPDDMAQCVQTMQRRWGGLVVVTSGRHGVIADDGQAHIHVPGFETQIVDRVGAGDALASGVLCGLIEAAPLERTLQMGAAVAALALSVPGDFARTTRAEVEALLAGNANRLNR